jgi:hypothetical protein
MIFTRTIAESAHEDDMPLVRRIARSKGNLVGKFGPVIFNREANVREPSLRRVDGELASPHWGNTFNNPPPQNNPIAHDAIHTCST